MPELPDDDFDLDSIDADLATSSDPGDLDGGIEVFDSIPDDVPILELIEGGK